MIEKGHLLKKIGFYQVLDVLPSDGRTITIHAFYTELNKLGHYNTFIRIKFELLKSNIIEFEHNDKDRKYIKLTGNGIILKLRLKEIITQIDKGGRM